MAVRTEENQAESHSVVGIPAEIRTGLLPKRYRLSQPLGLTLKTFYQLLRPRLWEAHGFLPSFLKWNTLWTNFPQVHYSVYKSPPLDSILSQLKPVNTFIPGFFTTHFSINFLSLLRSSKWFLSFSFSNWTSARATQPTHIICFYLVTLIVVGEE
jgi:hypothetical protein